MSQSCQVWVWDNSETNGNDRLVLLAIADEADDDGGNAYPSMDRIARKCRVNRATVNRSIRRLEDIGELVVERPEEYGRGRYNVYTLVMGRDAETVAECNLSRKARKPPKDTATKKTTVRKGAEGRAQMQPDPKTLRPESEPKAPRVKDLMDTLDGSLHEARFERFWLKYPRKTDKGGARKAYVKAAKQGVEVEKAIWSGVQRFAADPNMPEQQYIPHASTWLTGERWNDGPLPERIRGKPNGVRPLAHPGDDDRTGPEGRISV